VRHDVATRSRKKAASTAALQKHQFFEAIKMEFSVKRRLFIFLLLSCLLSPSALYGEVVTQRSSTRPTSQTPATAAAPAKLP
jgi:hypothetical protein